MVIHAIVDYSFLYYKYKFQLEAGRMRRLTSKMEWNGDIVEKDISQIYYSMREIESFRRKIEEAGMSHVFSICFDMKSSRKDEGTAESEKYKSNRGSKLTEDDFENIRFVEKTLNKAGYNTYRKEEYEADDLIAYLVETYKDEFDHTVIYTPDADLLVNIQPGVSARRYKTGSGYTTVNVDNFSEYLTTELKCRMPFNALLLYKCTVGDKSDCIDGIKKFGPKAFEKMVEYLESKGINWGVCNKVDSIIQVLNALKGYLTEQQLNEAKASFNLVRPKTVTVDMPAPVYETTREKRLEAYTPYRMTSLID